MSKLADAIAAENNIRKGPACSLSELRLPPADMADLQAALADDTVRHAAISRALKAEPFRISLGAQAISRHRKGECGCAR